VLSDLRQEIQWIKHLEVTGGSGPKLFVTGFREAAHRIVLALVDHLPGLGHLNHPGLAEGTPQEILDEVLLPFRVARLQPDALVHTKAGVFPRTDVGDDLLGNLALGQEQGEDLLLPELEERLAGQFGQGQKYALGHEHPFGHQRVNVRVPVD